MVSCDHWMPVASNADRSHHAALPSPLELSLRRRTPQMASLALWIPTTQHHFALPAPLELASGWKAPRMASHALWIPVGQHLFALPAPLELASRWRAPQMASLAQRMPTARHHLARRHEMLQYLWNGAAVMPGKPQCCSNYPAHRAVQGALLSGPSMPSWFLLLLPVGQPAGRRLHDQRMSGPRWVRLAKLWRSCSS